MVFRHLIDRITKLPRAGAWVGMLLFLPRTVINVIKVILTAIKRILVRRWAKEIAAHINHERGLSRSKNPHGCNNLAGLGGQGFRLRWTTWDELFSDSDSAALRRWGHRSNVVREHLFFAYFGPLEAWCDRNLHSGYYLWSDDNRINLVLTDPMDEVLWKMTWGSGMPKVNSFGSDSDEISLP